MKRLLLLTAIFLSGCAEVQQNIKNSMHLAYDYRDQYQPYSGEFDANHFDRSKNTCDYKAELHREGAVIADKRGFFGLGTPDAPNYSCSPNVNGRSMSCSPQSSNVDDRNSREWDNKVLFDYDLKKKWDESEKLYHKACMSENGYKLVRVCFRNCEQPNQHEEKGTIGIEFKDLTVQERSFLGRNTGVKIVNIRLDSPAYYANVLVGDYLIFLDDQPVANVAQMMKMSQAIDWTKRSKTVLVVIRDSQEMGIEVDLASDRR